MIKNLTIIMLGLLSSHALMASDAAQYVSESEGLRNERAFVNYLWPTLKASGGVGRIYFSARCDEGAEYDNALPFPRMVNSEPASKGGRKGFQRGAVAIRKDKQGITRVRVGRPSAELLNTRISTLSFDEVAQYNVTFALAAIENNAQVQESMRLRGMKLPVGYINKVIIQPDPRLPHLESTLTNVTMEQALDRVATTFKGAVIYGECMNQRGYSLQFANGDYIDGMKAGSSRQR